MEMIIREFVTAPPTSALQRHDARPLGAVREFAGALHAQLRLPRIGRWPSRVRRAAGELGFAAGQFWGHGVDKSSCCLLSL